MKDMSFDEFNESFQATIFNLKLAGSDIAVIMGALTMLREVGRTKFSAEKSRGPITDILLKISKQIDEAIDKRNGS